MVVVGDGRRLERVVGLFLNMCAMWVSAGVDGKGELWGGGMAGAQGSHQSGPLKGHLFHD